MAAHGLLAFKPESALCAWLRSVLVIFVSNNSLIACRSLASSCWAVFSVEAGEPGALNSKTCTRLARPFAKASPGESRRDQRGVASLVLAGPARSNLVCRPIAAKALERRGVRALSKLVKVGE